MARYSIVKFRDGSFGVKKKTLFNTWMLGVFGDGNTMWCLQKNLNLKPFTRMTKEQAEKYYEYITDNGEDFSV